MKDDHVMKKAATSHNIADTMSQYTLVSESDLFRYLCFIMHS
jgi:hypothetical protein